MDSVNVITAFIMLKIEGDFQQSVMDQVKEWEEVRECCIMFGEYDCVIKAEFISNKALSSFIIERVAHLQGVVDSITNVCAEF
jgi:DNA-binding Lrp family transcriptional regulator